MKKNESDISDPGGRWYAAMKELCSHPGDCDGIAALKVMLMAIDKFRHDIELIVQSAARYHKRKARMAKKSK